jgi:hypothetical protein
MKNSKEHLNWYEKELMKDKRELEREKNKIINEISGLSKDEIIPKPTKLTLWQKIKKVLMG